MKIKYLNLWEYQIDSYGRDCDGYHHNGRKFMATERPNEVVYNEADLFGDAGPSNVRLVNGSDQDGGTAYVSTPTEEGFRNHDISWSRVTSSEELAEFLDAFEKDGPRLSTDFYYTDLYQARIRALVKEKFPKASSVTFTPSAVPGAMWSVVKVRGLDERNCPATFWEGEGSPFEEDALKQISHDLEQVYTNLAVGDTQPVSVRV
ncbi:hypothetical protein [Streptomyces atratus]|uniref:hypothetical protein n=1 Tax=Streptomyces atratus TaxID=1893 RepID=UPI003651C6D0